MQHEKKSFQNTQCEQLITIKELMKILHISRATVYSRIKYDPEFPKPIKLFPGGRAVRFYLSDVIKYLEKRRATQCNGE